MPQGLKPAPLSVTFGATEVVPFHEVYGAAEQGSESDEVAEGREALSTAGRETGATVFGG
jgi:hypothetical protein